MSTAAVEAESVLTEVSAPDSEWPPGEPHVSGEPDHAGVGARSEEMAGDADAVGERGIDGDDRVWTRSRDVSCPPTTGAPSFPAADAEACVSAVGSSRCVSPTSS